MSRGGGTSAAGAFFSVESLPRGSVYAHLNNVNSKGKPGREGHGTGTPQSDVSFCVSTGPGSRMPISEYSSTSGGVL